MRKIDIVNANRLKTKGTKTKRKGKEVELKQKAAQTSQPPDTSKPASDRQDRKTDGPKFYTISPFENDP